MTTISVYTTSELSQVKQTYITAHMTRFANTLGISVTLAYRVDTQPYVMVLDCKDKSIAHKIRQETKRIIKPDTKLTLDNEEQV